MSHPATITLMAHLLVVITISIRVIMKRPATGVALAWLLFVAAIPALGFIMYLLIGERRIGTVRAERMGRLRSDYRAIVNAAVQQGIAHVDWSKHPSPARGLDRMGHQLIGSPTLRGSRFQLFSDTEEVLGAIAGDVDQATTSVLMEFYIWNEGGLADEVLHAVIRAAQRGVRCRLLIDAIGARPWWKGKQPQQLREAGVMVREALPVGLFRAMFGRTDLRLHRKIIVIDGEVGWTGSMNLVDPRYFKQDAGVGQWVDAMARVEGATVAALASVMIGDWALESGEPLEDLIRDAGLRLLEPQGEADVQVIPSGPMETSDTLLQMILGLLYAARDELILTTPYLVPDEALLRALRGAAARGVRVSLIIPEKVDSFLTRYASRSYYVDLLEMGVRIYLYRGGLLHTKAITADDSMSMFGTVNLDMRSLWLNFEVTMFVYDEAFTRRLKVLLQSYIDDSVLLDPKEWEKRSLKERFLENTMRLASPLL